MPSQPQVSPPPAHPTPRQGKMKNMERFKQEIAIMKMMDPACRDEHRQRLLRKHRDSTIPPPTPIFLPGESKYPILAPTAVKGSGLESRNLKCTFWVVDSMQTDPNLSVLGGSTGSWSCSCVCPEDGVLLFPVSPILNIFPWGFVHVEVQIVEMVAELSLMVHATPPCLWWFLELETSSIVYLDPVGICGCVLRHCSTDPAIPKPSQSP